MATAESDDDPLPQTRAERTSFILFALAAGTGWEILYRGFLLWFLTPLLGLILSVCVAALAYGLAHALRCGTQARQFFEYLRRADDGEIRCYG